MFNVTPVFHDIYNCKAKIIVLQGGTSCFAGSQMVITDVDSKPICELNKFDIVKSFNVETGNDEYKTVTDIHKFKNQKRTVRITLKNGKEIVCTDDHEFFFNGGWNKVKDILSLLDGRAMETDTIY